MKIDPNNEYKKYFDKISPDSRLLEDTRKKMMEELNSTVYQENRHLIVYRKIAAAAACFIIVGSAVIMVPKLKNVPVSPGPGASVMTDQTTCSSSDSKASEPAKSSAVSSNEKIKETSQKNIQTEKTATSVASEFSVSSSASKPNNAARADEFKNTSSVSHRTNGQTQSSSGVSSETAKQQNAAETSVTQISALNVSKTESSAPVTHRHQDNTDPDHNAGGNSSGGNPSVDRPSYSGTEYFIETSSDGSAQYFINDLYNIRFGFYGDVAHLEQSSIKIENYSSDDEISKLNALADKYEFSRNLVVPDSLVKNNTYYLLNCASDSFVYSFKNNNNNKSVELSIANSGLKVGYTMELQNDAKINKINNTDVIISKGSSELGCDVFDNYCVFFQKTKDNGQVLDYYFLFTNYDLDEVIESIKTMI